jgi:indole-3-glycerol phosphate synthase
MADILDEIVANTKVELAERKDRVSQQELEAQVDSTQRDFFAALRRPGIRVIAECKRQSPSRGIMVDPYDPVSLAKHYEAGGAAALSVLTDQKYFGGTLEDLRAVRAAVDLPILRKDFIVDPYQIYEARVAGADTFLLLSGVLNEAQLREYLYLGRSLGMEPLVESHSPDQLEISVRAGAKILGINNRNLKTFAVDLDHARSQIARLRTSVPDGIAVCESGIKTPNDIRSMAKAGYQCFLIGESVATANDPQSAVQEFVQAQG